MAAPRRMSIPLARVAIGQRRVLRDGMSCGPGLTADFTFDTARWSASWLPTTTESVVQRTDPEGPSRHTAVKSQPWLAVPVVLASGIPMVLVQYTAARQVLMTGSDLDRFARTGPAGWWVTSRSRTWLKFWRNQAGLDGF